MIIKMKKDEAVALHPSIGNRLFLLRLIVF